MLAPKLAIFDFDYTLVNANSSNYLNKLVIERELHSGTKRGTPSVSEINKFRYPDEIETLKDTRNNTTRMNRVFDYMHSRHGITQTDMDKCLRSLELTNSMKNLIVNLRARNFSLSIVSDSNKFVINTILRQNGLLEVFDNVWANEARFDSDGRLVLSALSKSFNQNGADFDCDSENCRNNICKGEIVGRLMEKHSSSGAKFTAIYVGDGSIDYCAGRQLRENDYFFVKKNSVLDRLLLDKELKGRIKAKVLNWKNGDDIWSQISDI